MATPTLHPDSGHRPGDLCNSNDGFGNPRHSVVNVFDGRLRDTKGTGPIAKTNPLREHFFERKPRSLLPPSGRTLCAEFPRRTSSRTEQVLSEGLIASLSTRCS